MIKIYKDPFNELIGDFFETPLRKIINQNQLVDLKEDDNEYRIFVSVPGLTKENLTLSINDNVIVISHEKNETDNKTFSFTNSFTKQYSIPVDVDEKKIDAKVENGILTVTLPKNKKKKIERTILIN